MNNADHSVAVVIHSGAVLLLRGSGHQGAYCFLPGGSVRYDETPETACLRCAVEKIREAAKEFGRQLKRDLREDELEIAIQREVASHPYIQGTLHYFLVQGNGKSILAGPESQPEFDEDNFIWPTYQWTPLAELENVALSPREAVDIIRGAAALPE